jgi:cytochrome c peroxidase
VKHAIIIILFFFLIACAKEPPLITTPYQFNFPSHFPKINNPINNITTVEGAALGRMLFYDTHLSKQNNISCATCHLPEYAFADSGKNVSSGNNNLLTNRNTQPLFNVAFSKLFFWDGGVPDLESTSLVPLTGPHEMANNLSDILNYLNNHVDYKNKFQKIYGLQNINSSMLLKVLAQFQRTIISSNSKYDLWKQGKATLQIAELNGFNLFINPIKGNCNGCHSLENLGSDNDFHNIGLDSVSKDPGRYRITLQNVDSGKFKTPFIRNLNFTKPYMHDGRFNTLLEVLEFKNSNYIINSHTDSNIIHHGKNKLSNVEILDIIAFLETLNDYEFIKNPVLKKP